MRKPPPNVVAALVEARRNRGQVPLIGPHGLGAHRAVKFGLAEEIGGFAELNLRGQDVADAAIALAATLGRKAP